MRVLVCGGRDYADRVAVYAELDKLAREHYFITVIEGGAKGADRLGRDWAHSRLYGVLTVEADWNAHGKAAGPIRNAKMLSYGNPDLVLAFPGDNGLDGGTGDMVDKVRAANIPVRIIGTATDVAGLFTT